MTEEREILGLWWLPSVPDDKMVGTLVLRTNKSPRLTVTVSKGFSLDRIAPKVIHGHDQHGKPISLLYPGPPRTRGGMALCQKIYSAGYAVLGRHLADPAEFCVNSLAFRMQHLFEWAGISGFAKTELDPFNEIHIRYSRPEDQIFRIRPDLSLEMRAAYSTENDRRAKKIEENLAVAFQAKQGFDLKHSLELINSFRHLLHFAVLEPVYPLEITTEIEGYGKTLDGNFIAIEIEIWNSIIRDEVESEIIPDRWIFQFKDLQANFAPFLGSWLDYLDKHREALGCYFSTVYHRLTHEIEHLSLTQAFDAYYGSKFAPREKVDFVDKIKQITEIYKPHLIGLVDDTTDFAETVRDNRNYYTHHDPRLKRAGRIVELGKLWQLNEKLTLLFQMCVLADIGIPNDRFVRLRRQLATQIIDYV